MKNNSVIGKEIKKENFIPGVIDRAYATQYQEDSMKSGFIYTVKSIIDSLIINLKSK